MSRFIDNESGSAAVLTAVFLTVLLGMTAMVVDVGAVFVERAKLQNAVDAAVLAAVQELPANPQLAEEVALDYGQRNGIEQGMLQVAITQENTTIQASSDKRVGLTFARALGYKWGYIEAQATAQVRPAGEVQGVAPLSIEEQVLQYGALYTLKSAAGHGESGWYGALSLGGSGASRYRDNLTNGYQGTVRIGDIVDTETGNMSGPTTQAIEARIARDNAQGGSTWDTAPRESPRILLVPVIQPAEIQGNQVKRVRIVGFASFYVEAVAGQGHENEIRGRFLHMVIPGKSDGTVDYGLYNVRLIG